MIESNILGVVKLPEDSNEDPPNKKRKVTVKKCRIYKTTSDVIVSNACVKHLDLHFPSTQVAPRGPKIGK